MIRLNELTPIGTIYKPHGINGEVSASFDTNVNPNALRCIVLDCDGIFVPFFINSIRSRGSQAVLMIIDGFSNEKEVAQLSNKTIYGVTAELEDDDITEDDELDDEDGFYASDFIGYTIIDDKNEIIGKIIAIDDRTDNFLFVVTSRAGNETYIPVADEFITGIDTTAKTLTMDLPIGLIDL
jgi:16S rRNA processing protein RimM